MGNFTNNCQLLVSVIPDPKKGNFNVKIYNRTSALISVLKLARDVTIPFKKGHWIHHNEMKITLPKFTLVAIFLLSYIYHPLYNYEPIMQLVMNYKHSYFT